MDNNYKNLSETLDTLEFFGISNIETSSVLTENVLYEFEFKAPKVMKALKVLKDAYEERKEEFEKSHVSIKDIRESTNKIKPKIVEELKGVTKENYKQVSKNVSAIVLTEYEQLTTGTKIAQSIAIVALIIFINTLLFGILAAILGMTVEGLTIAMSITAIVVAPITEELGKHAAVKSKYPWLYNTVFAFTEMLMYIVNLVKVYSMKFFKSIVVLRGVGVFLHYFTTFIQKKFNDKALKTNDDKYNKIGLGLAILTHSLFNICATVFQKKIMKIAGLPSSPPKSKIPEFKINSPKHDFFPRDVKV